MPWHQVWATHPLGRGLDHPLIDPEKQLATYAQDKIPLSLRFGEPFAQLELFRADKAIEHPVALRLLRLAEPHFFRVAGPQGYVREHLPHTDFAYAGWPMEKEKERSSQGRWRRIFCNQRARKALIEAGVMKPARFEPVAIVPAAEANAEVLDRTIPFPVPLPTYTPDEAASERNRREAIIGARIAITAPVNFNTIEHAAAALEERLASGAARWMPLRDDPALHSEIHASELLQCSLQPGEPSSPSFRYRLFWMMKPAMRRSISN